MTRFNTAIVCMLLITLATLANAAPPRTITYQGYLKDTGSGAPITASAKPMGFALYSTTGGTIPLWSESQAVKVDKGIYNVELGTTNPITLPFDTRYYLGITVTPDTVEMTPRQPLTTAPYAFRAGCIPGDMLNCYTGPAGTLAVGLCKSGIRTCSSDGSSFGPCTGEIIPSQEVCYNLVDEDCDGNIDNGCTPRFCEPGTSVACYSGPIGTQNIGACHAGTMTCSGDGSAYGPCVGEQGPSVELCDGMDNDCDGIVDNGISYPPVTNGQFVCNNGAASLVCNTGFGSCLSSGACDTLITNDSQNCGGCGNVCPAVANGTPGCNNSSCTIAACNTGFGNCDGNMSNGCEVNLMSTAAHCGACGTTCGVNESCQNGACIKPIGSVCITNSQCSSGFCVDGVCCNTSCNGTCQACSSAKTGGVSGTCSNLPNGTDPDNECADQGAASCGTSGYCSGSGSCSYYSAGAPSGAASCSVGIYTPPSTCSGSGSVITGSSVSCSPYTCANSSACRTTCTVTNDCANGFVCSSGVCQASPPNGTTCNDGNPCTVNDVYQSGICAGVPVTCDDGIACTTDSCNPATGGCVNTPVDAACSDGNLCNGSEQCSAVAGCLTGTPVNCDDGNSCTSDVCDAQNGCLNSILPDATPCGTGLTCQAGSCI